MAAFGSPSASIFSTHSARPSVFVVVMPGVLPAPPAPRIRLLALRRDVDLDPQRLELEARHLAVDRVGHGMHPRAELAHPADEVLDGERLVGEGHVHDGGGMALP